jgi:hypothetical protein
MAEKMRVAVAGLSGGLEDERQRAEELAEICAMAEGARRGRTKR